MNNENAPLLNFDFALLFFFWNAHNRVLPRVIIAPATDAVLAVAR
jgi:hypothetical protein